MIYAVAARFNWHGRQGNCFALPGHAPVWNCALRHFAQDRLSSAKMPSSGSGAMQIQESTKATLRRVLHQMKKCLSCATALLLPLFFMIATASAQMEAPLHPQALPAARIARKPVPEEPPIVIPAKDSSLMEAVLLPLGWPEPPPSLPDLPAQVAIPAKQHIPVVLDSTLSTVNSKQGQTVTFRTLYSLLLDDGLEVPPETEILGHVVEVKRPAHFGREGELRLAVDRIRLDPDGGTNLVAHLASNEMKGPGRFTNDPAHSPDVRPVIIESAGDALLGAAADGATGAAIGAGTSAAMAVLILKSPRGQDVYLEQGMRFVVILDQPAYLSGAAVYAAQQEFMKNSRPEALEPDPQPSGQPQLRRRRPSSK
jgi:hypothetical protein